MTEEFTIANSHDQRDGLVELASLFLMTAGLLFVAESMLSRNAAMTTAALRLLGCGALLMCSVALLWRRTQSFESSLLFIPLYMAVVLWVASAWLLLPLVAAALVFVGTTDFRSVGRTILSTKVLT